MKKSRATKTNTWAIKNKSKQWEHTEIVAYRRAALCWPLMPDNSLNTEYKWPLDGELISGFNPKSSATCGSNQINSGKSSQDTDKTIRIIAAEHEANSKWINLIEPLELNTKKSFNQEKHLLELFTSELNLPKAAKRCWLSDYAEVC